MIIRPAKETDAECMCQIIRDSFDEEADQQRIHHQILHKPRLALVAERDGVLVGFVDGFRTVSFQGHARQGHARMELDLLAVAPTHVGQGIGSLLVQAFLAQVPDEVEYTRALVAVDNTAMQKLCVRLGFEQSVRQSLYIQQADQVPIAAQYIVPVSTLTYDGWWLEGDILRDETLQANTRNTFGAVVAVGSEAAVILQEVNFTHVKDYHWWTMSR